MSVINQNLLLTPEGYQISRSVRLRSSASAYFNRTPASAGNRQTWTWSAWVKRGQLGAAQALLFSAGSSGAAGYYDGISLDSDTLLLVLANSGGSGTSALLICTQVFRDPSAWYHIVVVVDTTQATASNRAKIYINGNQVTSFSTATYPSLNYQTSFFQTTVAHYHGCAANAYAGQRLFDGYLTEVNFIDGQALTPSSFGETDAVTGVWKPKKYAGTYGTNGFYLNFSDNSAATAAAIGKDSSGNGNNWTPNNISVTSGVTYDSMLDVPTPYADGGNGRGNYCVLNPLNKGGSNVTVLDGNLGISTAVSNVGVAGTIGVSTGKWYWEITFTNASGVPSIGAAPSTWDKSFVGSSSGGVGYHGNGIIYNNGTNVQSGLASYTSGDVIGVALDLSAGSITFYKNNVQQGTTVTGLTGEWFPAVAGQTSSTLASNFGQRPFAYTPPTGFKALNTQNLPDATIKKGNQYFDATTYTGTGSAQSIVNSGAMQPDFVWAKSRSNAYPNVLVNSIVGATTYLVSNTTAAETTDAGYISAINSNGFSVGTSGGLNVNGGTFVAWQWKESASAGFDIVTYTGTGVNRTIAHSLGVAPKMIIAKHTNAVDNWIVYHASLGGSPDYLWLNLTSAKGTSSAVWNTAPTSSVFGVGTDNLTNLSGGTYVAYLFAEVAGFSKFGSYTGNGSADGPFVYCGFRPRWVMVKRTDTTGEWDVYDTSRDTYNAAISTLFPHLSNAEYTSSTVALDIVSNGFKWRTGTDVNRNASGGTYIFAAFAENPFKNSLAR